MNGFRPFLTPSRWVLGLGLFQNMFHNLLIYTNNFLFWVYYCILLLWNFPRWVAGGRWKSDFNENPLISLDLDLGLWHRVCQNTALLYKVSPRPYNGLTRVQLLLTWNLSSHWSHRRDYNKGTVRASFC